jgi:hypothetical protein
MSAPASSSTSIKNMGPSDAPNSAESNSTPNGGAIASVRSVVGSSQPPKTLIIREGTGRNNFVPGVNKVDALSERTAAAAPTKGSTAGCKVVIPKPSGGTANLSAVSECLKDKVGGSQVPKSAVTALAAYQDFCTLQGDFPVEKSNKKRKSSASNSDGWPKKKIKHQDTPIPVSEPLDTLQEASLSTAIRPSPSSP